MFGVCKVHVSVNLQDDRSSGQVQIIGGDNLAGLKGKVNTQPQPLVIADFSLLILLNL